MVRVRPASVVIGEAHIRAFRLPDCASVLQQDLRIEAHDPGQNIGCVSPCRGIFWPVALIPTVAPGEQANQNGLQPEKRKEIKACQIGIHCCTFRVSAAHDSTETAPLVVLIRSLDLLSCIRLMGLSKERGSGGSRDGALLCHCGPRTRQPSLGGRWCRFCWWPNKT